MYLYREKKRGYTLLEVVIAVTLLTVVMFASISVMDSTNQYAVLINETTALQEKVDKILYTIREDLLQVKIIFERGSTFGDALVFNTNPPLVRTGGGNVENLIAPDIGGADGKELFGIDGTSEIVQGDNFTYGTKTGNFLIFVKTEESARLNINEIEGADYTVDLYRIVAYYPSFVADARFNTGYRSDLIRWQSDLFGDFNQVEKIEPVEPDRRRVLNLLINKGITHLANFKEANIANVFHRISVNGGGLATGTYFPDPNYILAENASTAAAFLPDSFSLAMPGVGDLNGNPVNPAGNKYSIVDDTFPGGFEAQVIQFGDYTTLLRLALVKLNRRGSILSREGEIIVRSSFF